MMASYVLPDGRIVAVRRSGPYAATVRELERCAREQQIQTVAPPKGEPQTIREVVLSLEVKP